MIATEERLAVAAPPFEQIGRGLADVFEGLRRAAADGILASALLSSMLILAGFGGFFLAWRGAASTLAVGVQLSYLVSGGVGGFALIAGGMGILYVQMSRHLAAREDAAWAIALERALGILDGIRATGRLGRRPIATQHDLTR